MYTFLLINPDGSIPVFEFAACPDGETACREAATILRRNPERRAVEVWNDTDRLCVVEREARA
jgi:hypothetical protein